MSLSSVDSLDSYKTASIAHQRQSALVLSRTTQQQSIRLSTHTASTAEENSALSVNSVQPVVPSTSEPLHSGIFSGASIGKVERCSFTFHVREFKIRSPRATNYVWTSKPRLDWADYAKRARKMDGCVMLRS